MKTRENVIIVERVMQKTVPEREVKVSITITELCRFIQAAREDEARKAPKDKGQYDSFRDALDKAKGPTRKDPFSSDLFGGLFK